MMLQTIYTSPILILFLSLFIASGCSTTEPEDDPGTDPKETGNEIAGDISMSKLTDLPSGGGEAADVAIARDGSVVAVLDGKLVRVPLTGGIGSTIDDGREYRKVVVTPSGTMIAESAIGLEVFDVAGGGPRTTGVLTTGSTVERTDLRLTSSGIPFMIVHFQSGVMSAHYSEDDGATWKKLSLPGDLRYGGGVASANTGNTLYVASSGGLYKTSNMGVTWTTYPAPVPGHRPELLVGSTGTLFAWVRGGGGFWRSVNGGAVFTQVLPFNRYPFFEDIVVHNFGVLYAAIGVGESATDSIEKVALSVDGGESWHTVAVARATSIDLTEDYLAVGLDQMNSDGENVGPGGVLIASPGESLSVVGGLDRVTRVQDVAFDQSGALLLLADHALYRRGGSAWEFVAGSSDVTHVATSGPAIFMSGERAIYINSESEIFSRVVPPADLFPTGTEQIATSDLIPRNDGGFFYSRGLRSGGTSESFGSVLYSISSVGGLTPLTPPPGGPFGPMSQSRTDILYTVRTSPVRDDNYRSIDGGYTWERFLEDSMWTFPHVFTRSNIGVSVSLDDLELTLSPGDTTPRTIYRMTNMPSGLPRLRELVLDAQGRAWIVVEGEGVWWSSETLE